MPNRGRALRAGKAVVVGRRRAAAVAQRLGTGLREARRAAGARQDAVARSAGISQQRLSELERGMGIGATLETWACAAAAVGEQLVSYLELAPGATPPRDIEHLRRQAALIMQGRSGGWDSVPEVALDPGPGRSRSADVVLLRLDRREAILCEIWDWFDDVGASLRSLDTKRSALMELLGRRHGGDWRVSSLFVVRRTRRNERLVAELRPLFGSRFPGASKAWIRALTDPREKLPTGDGLLWSRSDFRLQASRLGR